MSGAAEIEDERIAEPAAPPATSAAAARDPLPMLTREELLKRFASARGDLRREPIDVEEWGCRVYAREVPARLRLRVEDLLAGTGELQGVAFHARCAELFELCIVGEDDEPLFRKKDADQVGEISPRVVKRLFAALAAANAIGKAGVAARLGESNAGANGAPSTGSHGPEATPIRDGS